jgi:hypothetical protein
MYEFVGNMGTNKDLMEPRSGEECQGSGERRG